ncbi:protein DMR6-LIKE OXYGENASE 2-like [Ananas comosus]|uniref:Protein DMR6-LIKE OXYGENASE 2-like n=1 Tax=Ananas comosus TaxID=4615 RepID=A0A6P5FAC5_ANACO|nr:protein DMR6-LIKE OXYGENASE 2-like [Ananas comosus]
MAAEAFTCSSSLQNCYSRSLPSSVKELSEAPSFTSLPQFLVSHNPRERGELEPVCDADQEIPAVDFDLLVNGSPDQRSQVVRELGRACRDWGFFMVVNHGVCEGLTEAMKQTFAEFFDLTAEEKGEYEDDGVRVMSPIRVGTSFNTAVDKVRYWRDYLKIIVHPVFHSPAKPPTFRDISQEYTTRMRALGTEILKGIWESLGLDGAGMTLALNLNSCFQILVANLYPPCPQPELAMGLPPHSDYGLLTVLCQNGVDGLQVKHEGKWIPVKPRPNSFLVNIGDQMEIVSNGRYKSVLHRAVLSGKSTRMSIVTLLAPSLETVVAPAPLLVSSKNPAAFRGMRFGDFIEYQQSNRLKDKSVLDLLRLNARE